MNLPKFVITMEGFFRLGMVNQHKHLLKPGDQCIGGGYYVFDFVSNRIILDRESYDFGRPKWHLLESPLCFFSSPYFTNSVAARYSPRREPSRSRWYEVSKHTILDALSWV